MAKHFTVNLLHSGHGALLESFYFAVLLSGCGEGVFLHRDFLLFRGGYGSYILCMSKRAHSTTLPKTVRYENKAVTILSDKPNFIY
jgi:hypothetical protein